MENVEITRKERIRTNKRNQIVKVLKAIGNTTKIIICSILIFIIATSCIQMIDGAMNPGKTPSVFGYKAMTVLTGSMEPGIKPGDLVIAKAGEKLSSLKVGSIATYKNSQNVLITHRVIDISSKDGVNAYKFKGDNNPTEDVDVISKDQLEGIYIVKIPYLGYVNMFVKSGMGIVTLIIIPLALIFGMELIGYISKKRQKQLSL